ncbi:MAG: hypothetical protein BWK80_55905 [Desulfobacteraceae bacterium IS3]|nr:MAG: hypothetical protein BWK80_55905 [Desulfobacteraceae bacterium IS3]
MEILRYIGITINVIALIMSLIACFFIGMLGSMFIGSISDTDKYIGIICFLLIPICLAISILSLIFVIKKTGYIFRVCLGIGISEIAFYIFAIRFLFAAIEAAARP